MSQDWTDDVYNTGHTVDTDMQNIEDNFSALKSMFSGSSAPSNPSDGQLWYDTGSSVVKIRYNSSWNAIWDQDGDMIAAGKVKTDSLMAGVLTTDSTGRAKMANGYITNAHVADVAASKMTGVVPSTNITYGAGQLIFSKPYSTVAAGAGVEEFILVPSFAGEIRILRINTFVPYGAKYVRGKCVGTCQDGCQFRLAIGSTYGSTGTFSGYSETTGNFGLLDVSTHAGQIKQVDIYADLANDAKSIYIYSMALWYSNT